MRMFVMAKAQGRSCAVKSPSFDPLLQKLPLKERPSPEKLLTRISPFDVAPEQFTSWYGTVCGDAPAVTTACSVVWRSQSETL